MKVLLTIFVSLWMINVHAQVPTTIEISGVPAVVKRIKLEISDPELKKSLVDVGGDFSYVISFGQLSLKQFSHLKTYFKKKEVLNYDSARSYELIDFLPAKMQALMHKRLISASRPAGQLDQIPLFYKNSGEIFGMINCWGTAWEMTRDASAGSPFNIFMSSRRVAQEALQTRGRTVDPQDTQFGDVLMLHTSWYGDVKIQHAAVAINKDFYFEKTDSDSAMFFRLVHLSDMQKRMNQAFEGQVEENDKPVRVSIELRRYDIPLPNPVKIFSVAYTKSPGSKEYIDVLPQTEKKDQVALFSDDRLGGGEEVVLTDMLTLDIQVNAKTGRGEVVPNSKNSNLIRKSEFKISDCRDI